MPFGRVYVGRDHVRLDLVRLERVRERVEHLVEVIRRIAVAEQGSSQYRPRRRMRVLRTVLADTGEIALDVTWIVVRMIERRRKELDETGVLADEMRVHRLGRLLLTVRFARA